MVYREPEPSDPMMLVGVSLPGSAEDIEEMAYALAEAYAVMGHSTAALEAMFACPDHTIPHRAYAVLGPARVREIVQECVECFGRVRWTVTDNADADLVQIGGLGARRRALESETGAE